MPYPILTLFAGGAGTSLRTLIRSMLGVRMQMRELVRAAPRLCALIYAVVRHT